MSWLSRKPKPLPIPTYNTQPSVIVRNEPKPKPKDEGIEVQELDATDVDIKELQSRTGIQRVFDRITGKFK